MKLFSIEENGYPKTILVLAVIFLVSSGLCGLQLVVANSSRGSSIDWVLIPLGILELVVMVLSAGGIVVVAVLWMGSVLYARFGKPQESAVQNLFNRDEDKKG